jgi:hypothetical protein
MQRIGRNNSGMTGTQAPSNAADRQFQFAFDDFVNFFPGDGNARGSTSLHRTGNARMSCWENRIAASPTRQAFDSFQLVGIDECHVP